MSARKETERAKLLQEKCQTVLSQMLRDEDNKYCVDCDAKGPRWASWNLGVFLCIRCAGIHRNLGVHISRVKSVNLDSWTPEQVVSLQQMGNSRARAVYEAQLPDGFRRPQTDSALESFIRAKYEHKKYLAREWVPPPPPKVDWDKEIDEEIERQKRKKKASQAGSSLGIVPPLNDKRSSNSAIKSPIPAPLPKPKSSNSPKTNRIDHASNASSDLLGLSSPTNSSGPIAKGASDLQNDSFSGFLSAPVSSSSSAVNGTSGNGSKLNDNKDSAGLNSLALAKEEADFFNQPNINSTVDKDKGKLTKDSILALYGSAPTSNLGQFNNNPLVGFNSTYSLPSHPQHQPPPSVAGSFMQLGAGGAAGVQMPTQQTFPAMVPAGGQFGVGPTGGIATNLNLNLAGMPPGLLGPPQPQPQTQFMTPPNSATIYNPPVMTAPGAFTVPQMLPPTQQSSFAHFPPQAFTGGIPTAANPYGPIGSPAIIPSTGQPASSNLSQQFGNLNLGNVWQ